MRYRVGALAVVVGLLGAACGGDGDSAGPAATTNGVTTNTVTTTGVPPATTAPAGSTAPAATTAPVTAPPLPAVPGDPEDVAIRLTEVARLDEPIVMAVRTGDDTLYIGERAGTVRALRGEALDEAPVLDLRDRIRAGGEQGLLGMAFSPDGRSLVVHYTARDGSTSVDELAVGPDGAVDPASRQTILTQAQPFANHNGGELTFGPDGMLYLGLGDGGSGNDPQRTALDLSTKLGKIVRIDPGAPDDGRYAVPPDNPFVGDQRVVPEIWSYGLRNPWRFSFDRATGDLWVADVGQNRIEEINRVPAGDGAGRGTNFGWSAFEGTRRLNEDQPAAGALAPVYEYEHDGTTCSVTGGYVYRGATIPALAGLYVFADYCAPGVRALLVAPDGSTSMARLTDEPGNIVSFGQDAAGELYVLSFDGTVSRLDPAT